MTKVKGSAGRFPHRIVIQPNDSLGRRGRLILFLLVALAALLVAGLATARGLWPVLPYAGLELLVLGLCLYLVQRHLRYREVITLDAEQLLLERGLGRPQSAQVFSRAWVRVDLSPAENRHAPPRLFLCEGRTRVEIGRCLTEDEKLQLRDRLRRLLSKD